MTNKKISVIIPAYNVEKYLTYCLESLRAQTYPYWECIVLNDGSKDNTLMVAKSFEERDSRIRVFSQENRGVGHARNALLEKVADDTDYLYIMDSDDMIHPEMFEFLTTLAREHDADIAEVIWEKVATDATLENIPKISYVSKIDELKASGSIKVLTDMDIYYSRKKAQGAWINNYTKILNYQKIKHLRFDNLLSNEDDFWFQTLVHHSVAKKVICGVAMYYYRANPTSLTRTMNWDRYTRSCAHRINLSFEHFVKTNRVPLEYRKEFMRDLARDAFRMALQKNLKKNKDRKSRRKVFEVSSEVMRDFVMNDKIDFSELSFTKRLAIKCAIHRLYLLSRFFAVIS